MNVLFIIPSFNSSMNIEPLGTSLINQTDDNWSAIIIDDISTDDTYSVASQLRSDKFSIVKNETKKFALRNIVETARKFQESSDTIIAVIDGDDSLCNPETVALLRDAYSHGHDVVWTAHAWDINGLNISKKMPPKVDPYGWPWCSSHLRTFKSSLLKDVSNKNFYDFNGEWFKRGYDQALMLPLLHVSKSRHFIEEVCYRYNINSVSIPYRDYEEMSQISTVNFVRARRFLDSE